MSLMVKVAERVADTIVNTTEQMLIAPAPNGLISPGPENLISSAPIASALLPLQVIAGIALFVGVAAALWRFRQLRRFP
jgi:hypothetical protein